VVLKLLVMYTPRNYLSIQSVFSYKLVHFKMRWMYLCTLLAFWPARMADPWTYVAESTECVTEAEKEYF
jgi:hypothetical protein